MLVQLLTLEHFQRMSEQWQIWPKPGKVRISSEPHNGTSELQLSRWCKPLSITGGKTVAIMNFLQLRLLPAHRCSPNWSWPLPDQRRWGQGFWHIMVQGSTAKQGCTTFCKTLNRHLEVGWLTVLIPHKANCVGNAEGPRPGTKAAPGKPAVCAKSSPSYQWLFVNWSYNNVI